MKRIALLLCVALLAVFFAGCQKEDAQITAIKERGVLRVGVKVDVPGFGWLNPDTNQLEGLEIDLARTIAEEILGDGQAVEFTGVTAQTRGPMLDNGELDLVIATFTITDERKQSFNFTQPYFHDEIGLLVKTDADFDALADMAGKTVGVVQSGTASAALTAEAEALGVQVSYREFASYPEIKAALDAGTIDAFAGDKSILSGYLDDAVTILPEGFNPQDYGIATKLENTALAGYLNELLTQLQKDGRMTEILARWGQQENL